MIRSYLPKAITKPLFGDRAQFQNTFDLTDKDWIEWQNFYEKFYLATQKAGIGSIVNNWGYKVISKLS